MTVSFPSDLSTDLVDGVSTVLASIDNGTRAFANALKSAVIESLDAAQPRQMIPINASAVSGPISVDDYSIVDLTLNANLANLDFAPPSGKPSRWVVWYRQDGTGGRTVTWDTDIVVSGSGGLRPSIDPRATKITAVEYESNGSGTTVMYNTQQAIWLSWSTPANTDVATVTGGAKFLVPSLAEIVFVQSSLVSAGTTGNMVADVNWAANADGGSLASLYSSAAKPTIASGSLWSGQALPDVAARFLIPSVAGKPGALSVDIDSVHTTKGKGFSVFIGLQVP